MKMGYSRILKAIIFILVITFTAILVYSPHFSYRFPLHMDEWYHLNEGVKVLDGIYEPRFRFNQGFHFFLAGIFVLEKAVGINVLLAYRFLPAIFAVFASLALFFLVRKIERDNKNGFWIAVLAMLFFASLRSNVNILGPIFAIPLTLAIPLCFTYFYFFIDLFDFENNKREKKKIKGFDKNLVFALFSLLTLSVIHVSIGLVILIISFFFALLNYKHMNKRIYIIFILPLITMILSLSFFVYTHYGESLSWKINLFISSFFKSSESRIDLIPIMTFGKEILLGSPYILPLFYGVIPSIFAVIGLYYCLFTKRQRLFAVWFIASAIILFLAESKLFPSYQRVFYLTLLSLPVLSAIGLYKFIQKAHSSIVSGSKKERLQRWAKIISILMLSALIFLIFFESIREYNKRTPQVALYYLINENDFSALNFLSDKEINGTIITPKNLVPAVYPATGHHPIVVWMALQDEKFDYLEEFFNGDCIKKEEFSKRYNSTFVISLKKIDCPFLSVVYDEENRFVYKVIR